MRPILSFLFGVAAAAVPAVAAAAELKVIGGSAVITVMEVLVPRFEAATGDKVVTDFDGAIGAMARRVEKGERADVLVVSRQQVDALAAAGKLLADSRAELARLGVGVFVRKGAPR